MSDTARDVVICEPVRTPIGALRRHVQRPHRRSTSACHRPAGAARAHRHRRRSEIDDVILGHCYPNSEAPAIGRVVALDAGLPITVAGQQLDRRCGSGLQAIVNAAMQVSAGAQRPRGGRRHGEHEQRRRSTPLDMRWGGGAQRRADARRPRPGRRHRRRPDFIRCPAACSRPPRTCGASTASPARSRTSSPCSSHRRAVAAQRGRQSSPRRSCRSPSATPEAARSSSTPTSTRAPTPRWSRSRGCARSSAQHRPRRDGHRRQRQRPERRRRAVPRHHRREGRRARPAAAGPARLLGRRRRRART